MQRNSALPPRWTLSNDGVTSTCSGVATTNRSSALASPPALLAEQRYIPASSGVTASITRMGPSSRVRGPEITGTGSAPGCVAYHLQQQTSGSVGAAPQTAATLATQCDTCGHWRVHHEDVQGEQRYLLLDGRGLPASRPVPVIPAKEPQYPLNRSMGGL